MSVQEKTRVVFDQEVEGRLSDDDTDFTGWFCVKTDPFPCPAAGCSFVAEYATAAHRILVWAELDDPALLDLCQRMLHFERNPKVANYETSFGPCIAYYQWEAIGRPIHATRNRRK